jgi:hypothetical protein
MEIGARAPRRCTKDYCGLLGLAASSGSAAAARRTIEKRDMMNQPPLFSLEVQRDRRCHELRPDRIGDRRREDPVDVAALHDPYRPELHYMRGPGPKWREVHSLRGQTPDPVL